MKKIIGAAVRRGPRGWFGTGLTHADAKLSAGGLVGECGFVTSEGKFVSRHEAAKIAIQSGQAKEISDPKFGLNSSDLTDDYPPCNPASLS